MCVCMCVCVRARARVCVCLCVYGRAILLYIFLRRYSGSFTEKRPLQKEIRLQRPVEAVGGAVLGVFGLTFLVAEVSLFVLIDLNVLRKQLMFGYKNLTSIFNNRHNKADFQPVAV